MKYLGLGEALVSHEKCTISSSGHQRSGVVQDGVLSGTSTWRDVNSGCVCAPPRGCPDKHLINQPDGT